nr:hypothetical protein Iba_scaffold35661CG0020 [Ipomoea batatas]
MAHFTTFREDSPRTGKSEKLKADGINYFYKYDTTKASKDAEECGIGLPKQFLFKSRCQPFSITSGRVGDYRSSCIAPFEKRDERGRDIRDSLTNNLAMFSNFILMVAVLEVAINGRGSYYLTAEFVLVSSAHCASRKRSTQSQHGSL